MEGHNWIGNQSPWPDPSDPSHRPDHSVAACFLRLPPFRGRCSSAKLSAGSLFFIAWCSPVVVSSPASYVYRTPSAVWGAAVFQVQCFSLSHSFLHLFRFAGMPLPPLIVRIRLVICKGVVFSFVAFLIQFPAVSISCTHCVTNVTQTLHII